MDLQQRKEKNIEITGKNKSKNKTMSKGNKAKKRLYTVSGHDTGTHAVVVECKFKCYEGHGRGQSRSGIETLADC